MKFKALLVIVFCFAVQIAYSNTKSKENYKLTKLEIKAHKESVFRMFDACNNINWASWSNFTGTSATGTILNADGTTLQISMTSNFNFDSTPSIYNYGKFSGYPSAIPNATVPRTTWAVGSGGTTTMCFSKTVTNPVLLLSSLGASSGISSRLDFDVPYVVLYDGGGMVYNSNTALTGTEGYAIIMFPGDFNCVTVHSSTPEYYTNITWGLRPPPFNIDVQTTSTTCGNTTLTASGGETYLWSDGDTPDKATNTFHKSGTYVVTVTNSSGCKTSVSKSITVLPGSIDPVVTGTLSGCSAVTLTASGGVSYHWDGGANPDAATNTFTQSGKYTVTVTGAAGCSGFKSVDVVITSPQISITGNATGCGSVTLTAGGGASYSWDGGDTPNSATNTFTQSGKYTVTVTDINGCTAHTSVDVVLNNLTPSIIISRQPNGEICQGTPVTFTANALNAGNSPSIQWLKNNQPAGTGNTYIAGSLVNNDKISCVVTSTDKCVIPPVAASNDIVITVQQPPVISFAQNTYIIKPNSSVQLEPAVTGNVFSYQWSPASGLNNAFIPNPVASPLATTTYTLTATTSAGCQTIASVNVVVQKDGLIIPNTFTPNNDGINDLWEISNIDQYPNALVHIYNRFGETVFQSNGYEKPWNGRYKNALVPSGVYYYVIDTRSGNQAVYSGYLTVLK